jgi:hypothetical protein
MVSNLTGKINLNTRISNSNINNTNKNTNSNTHFDNSQKAKNIEFKPNVSKVSDDILSKTQYEIKQMRGTVTNLKSINTGTGNKTKHNYTIAMPKKNTVKENLLLKSINVNSKEFDREEILAKNSLGKGYETIEVSSGINEKHVTNHGKLLLKAIQFLYLIYFKCAYLLILIYLFMHTD